MKNILVTGGTVFVSKYIANYFKKNNNVYVLNRNTRPQIDGVNLIKADRNALGDKLKQYNFDVIIDVCAYNKEDVNNLLNSLDSVKDYILISSSAVYPETNSLPFKEEQMLGANSIWGKYGTNKIEAENALISKIPQAYILRPPYLYEPMQNIYRKPFVFDCAIKYRKFYIPKDGKMKLQFFHVEDLCKVIEKIINLHPSNHIYNVGNEELIDINTFVGLCYKVVGKKLETINVYNYNQRDYFCFNDYEYCFDITRQKELLPKTKNIEIGLQESFDYYINHTEDVMKKPYIDFIINNFE